MIFLLSLLGLLVYSAWKYWHFVKQFKHIPGPEGHLIWGNDLMKNGRVNIELFEQLRSKFGPVHKIRFLTGYTVVVCDYESIRQILITEGWKANGRPRFWRNKYATHETGILSSPEADATWKMLRKVSHRHLKQFGEGMTRLEHLITEIAEDMFAAFTTQVGNRFDPNPVIFETALKTLAFLFTGQKLHTHDPLLELMREYEPLIFKTVRITFGSRHVMYDMFPWMRYLGGQTWHEIAKVPHLTDDIWKNLKSNMELHPESVGLVKILLWHTDVPEYSMNEVFFHEDDAKYTCVSLLFAGIVTTSRTFSVILNILSNRQEVQDAVFQEILNIVGKERSVSLADRPNLPYTRAVILEVLRYFTVAALGVEHRTVVDMTVKGYHIPKDTTIRTNLWGLHHDKEFWGDPYAFRPERFLDDVGELVPADHPNRTHLMPFGAGPRVCLGESLALARLFLWTVACVQRFVITPAEKKKSLVNEGDLVFSFDGPSFYLIFNQRH